MFHHSVRVPHIYTSAAKIVQNVTDKGGSVRNLVFEMKHGNIKGIYALVVNTLKRNKQLDFLFKRTKILEKEPRLSPWFARVLITELLWGKKRLSGNSKPVKTVLAYQQILNAHATDVYEDQQNNLKGVKPRFVRVNTILASVNEVIDGFRDDGWTFVRHTETKNYDDFLKKVSNLADNEFMVDIHVPELLIFPPKTEFHSHHAYRTGVILLQDKASCLPVHLLNPTQGSNVLDMCAAPGMKTSQLAAKLDNNGTVYAVDVNKSRLKTLEQLMEATGVTCVKVIENDVLRITNIECPLIEYILVDPSCSGSGIVDRLDFGKHPEKDEYRIRKLQGFQIMILKHALRKFPTAKRVIYSTCSVYPEENEEVIKEILPQISNYKLVPAADLLKNSWFNYGSEKYGDIGKFCLYSKHDMDLTNGFFIAIFERLKEGEENPYFLPNTFTRFRNINSEQDIANQNIVITENTSKEKKRKKHNEDKNKSSMEEHHLENIKTNTDLDVDSSCKKKKKKKKHSENNAENVPEINLNIVDDKKHGISLNYEEINSKTKSKKKRKTESQNENCDNNFNENVDQNVEITTAAVNKSKKKQRNKSNTIDARNSGELEVPLEANKEKNKTTENLHVFSTEESKNHESLDQNNATEPISKKKKHKKKKQEKPEDENDETLNHLESSVDISEEKIVGLNIVENEFDGIINQKVTNELEVSPESKKEYLKKKKHRDICNELEESLNVSPEKVKKGKHKKDSLRELTYDVNIIEVVDQNNSAEVEESIKQDQERAKKKKHKKQSLHALNRNNNSDEMPTETNKDNEIVDHDTRKKKEKIKKNKDEKNNLDVSNANITNNDECLVETNKNVIKKHKKQKLNISNNIEDDTLQSPKKDESKDDDTDSLNELGKSLLKEAGDELQNMINEMNKTPKKEHKRRHTNEIYDLDHPKPVEENTRNVTLNDNCNDQRNSEEELEKNKRRKHKKQNNNNSNLSDIVSDTNAKELEEIALKSERKTNQSICAYEKRTEEITDMDFREETFTPEELDIVNMLNEYFLNKSRSKV